MRLRIFVSMPPRRSCFAVFSQAIWEGWKGFNATTAFLLPRLEWEEIGPFRGFNATTAFLLPSGMACPCGIGARFQCHHGVPASRCGGGHLCHAEPVSMPPRRSCFEAFLNADAHAKQVSMPPRRSCFTNVGKESPAPTNRFNATTAFLLRVWC